MLDLGPIKSLESPWAPGADSQDVLRTEEGAELHQEQKLQNPGCKALCGLNCLVEGEERGGGKPVHYKDFKNIEFINRAKLNFALKND